MLYRQSDIPEIPELTWILHSVTAKGLMNRAHAYKAAVAENEATPGRDPDQAITMTLYSYPILMAADILMFKAAKVPVGKDQKQHVEMARDIAQRFNHHFGETFVLPDAVIGDNIATLPGLDGRKMTKSYGNVIPLFAGEKAAAQADHEDQDELARAGAAEGSERQRAVRHLPRVRDRRGSSGRARALRRRHRLGRHEAALVRAHQRGDRACARASTSGSSRIPREIEDVLRHGAEKARAVSRPFLAEIRDEVGIRPLAR